MGQNTWRLYGCLLNFNEPCFPFCTSSLPSLVILSLSGLCLQIDTSFANTYLEASSLLLGQVPLLHWFSRFQKFAKIFHVLYVSLCSCEIELKKNPHIFAILLVGFRREFRLRDNLPCLTGTPTSTSQNAPSWNPRTRLQSW